MARSCRSIWWPAATLACFAKLKRKARARTGRSVPIIVLQEAGCDGFWAHHDLQTEDIASHVVDPVSIAVSRRRRPTKTDKLDGEVLVRALFGLQTRRTAGMHVGSCTNARRGRPPPYMTSRFDKFGSRFRYRGICRDLASMMKTGTRRARRSWQDQQERKGASLRQERATQDWLGKGAMNQMRVNVSPRTFKRPPQLL